MGFEISYYVVTYFRFPSDVAKLATVLALKKFTATGFEPMQTGLPMASKKVSHQTKKSLLLDRLSHCILLSRLRKDGMTFVLVLLKYDNKVIICTPEKIATKPRLFALFSVLGLPPVDRMNTFVTLCCYDVMEYSEIIS